MDNAVDSIVKKCCPCQIATPKPSRETLKMTQLPCGPWHQVSVDFCEVAELYVLVVIHDYSRFPDIEIVHSTAANAVIPKLDRIFAAYEVVKTDNGPSFNEHKFAQFADYLGFVFRKVASLWPEANGEVERFMRSFGKVLRTTTNWKQQMYQFLRNYCATPHSSTGVAQLLLFLDDQSGPSNPAL